MSDARSNKRLASSVSSSLSRSSEFSELLYLSLSSSNPKSLKNWRAADATKARSLTSCAPKSAVFLVLANSKHSRRSASF